ncbi:DUF4349 domain-containing protein [Saccharopolyspora sp. WRP15-2]|uniref:DUF4349 domain-containing protein n=1 Tax=Saccharopolyspora oryzae TaxID=2997343 RepID=A0ABT4V2M2_9PSEU|nr:DUF4349 domain-containing protein [Saccharopolyspora oryzae]MDA3628053.1 DUF4349 domain-containing protein [Saccharopolyspora oryzae]
MRLRWIPVVLAAGLLAGCSSTSTSAVDSGVASVAPESQRSSQFAKTPGRSADPAAGQQREVVRTADLDLEVDDVAAASAEVRRRAEAVHGYLEQEDGYRSSTTLTVRIPAAELDRALDDLSGLGRVTARSLRAQDVTDQLVDTRSRIESQQASVQRLRDLMARATTVEDVVSIESELTTRETDLEALQRQEASTANQVQLATLRVGLATTSTATTEETGFLAGLAAGWRALTEAGAAFLTAAGAVLPFAAVLAVPAAALYVLHRRKKALKASSL